MPVQETCILIFPLPFFFFPLCSTVILGEAVEVPVTESSFHDTFLPFTPLITLVI